MNKVGGQKCDYSSILYLYNGFITAFAKGMLLLCKYFSGFVGRPTCFYITILEAIQTAHHACYLWNYWLNGYSLDNTDLVETHLSIVSRVVLPSSGECCVTWM